MTSFSARLRLSTLFRALVQALSWESLGIVLEAMEASSAASAMRAGRFRGPSVHGGVVDGGDDGARAQVGDGSRRSGAGAFALRSHQVWDGRSRLLLMSRVNR